MSIAGNIETNDGYVIVAQRGKNVENAMTYSCSVNGVAEVNNKHVELYQDSVLVDKPTIDVSDDVFTFEGEFNRETIAELGITEKLSWNYMGVGLFNIPNLEKDEKRISVVFDVIGFTRIFHSLNQMRQFQETAVEKNENSKLIGYQLKAYKNQTAYLKARLVDFMRFFLNKKGLLLILVVAFPNFRTLLDLTFHLDLQALVNRYEGNLVVLINDVATVMLFIIFLHDLFDVYTSSLYKTSLRIIVTQFKFTKVKKVYLSYLKNDLGCQIPKERKPFAVN